MILVVDVGNTHTVLGLYQERVLLESWRLATHFSRTEDEYGMMLHNLFSFSKIRAEAIRGMIISCVVPPMLKVMVGMAEKLTQWQPTAITNRHWW